MNFLLEHPASVQGWKSATVRQSEKTFFLGNARDMK